MYITKIVADILPRLQSLLFGGPFRCTFKYSDIFKCTVVSTITGNINWEVVNDSV